MAGPSRHPMAVASEWVGRIMTAVIMMVGPAWLCDRYVASRGWTLVALLAGVAAGTAYLIVTVRGLAERDRGGRRGGSR